MKIKKLAAAARKALEWDWDDGDQFREWYRQNESRPARKPATMTACGWFSTAQQTFRKIADDCKNDNALYYSVDDDDQRVFVCISNIRYEDMKKVRFSVMQGSFIGYKKALSAYKEECVITLLIPDHARKYFGDNGKCRATSVIPIKFERCTPSRILREMDDLTLYSQFFHRQDGCEAYVIGKETHSDGWGEECDNCTHGIHFFLDKKMAEAW